jgi:large subunit ribosomal protein L29
MGKRTAKFADLTSEELRREQDQLEGQIFRLRFQLRTGNAENPSRLGETRRDLARVKTLLRQIELGLRGKQGAETAKPARTGKATAGSASEAR